jgi:hypothetical protein
MSLESAHIGIEFSHIFRVDEDKGFFRIQSNSDDVLDVFISQSGELFKITALLMEIFLIICNLDDKRNVKSFLEILAEDEWEHMSKMESF